MTPPKRWPNGAEYARTESVAQANKILLQMEPMKKALEEGKTVTSLELSIRIGRISDAANVIVKELAAFSRKDFTE